MSTIDMKFEFPELEWQQRDANKPYPLDCRVGEAVTTITEDTSKGLLLYAVTWEEHMLAKGADINLQDSHGKTALMHAVHVHPVMIRELLAHKPNLDVQDIDGDTALMLTAKMDRADRAEILVNAEGGETARRYAETDCEALLHNPAPRSRGVELEPSFT